MITIYGGWPTRGVRILWLLEEMGLPYAMRPVDIRQRGSDAEFMAVNPAGFLPVMVDGDVRMVESIAIMEYLTARYGPTELAPSPGDQAFPAYQQFLHLGEAGLAAYLNVVVASQFMAPEGEKENWGAQTSKRLFASRLKLVSEQLERAPYLAGEVFTAADISVAYALELASRLDMAGDFPAPVQAFLARVSARDAYRRAAKTSPVALPTR
jgi:glutathione S-transferase